APCPIARRTKPESARPPKAAEDARKVRRCIRNPFRPLFGKARFCACNCIQMMIGPCGERPHSAGRTYGPETGKWFSKINKTDDGEPVSGYTTGGGWGGRPFLPLSGTHWAGNLNSWGDGRRPLAGDSRRRSATGPATADSACQGCSACRGPEVRHAHHDPRHHSPERHADLGSAGHDPRVHARDSLDRRLDHRCGRDPLRLCQAPALREVLL